MIQRTLSCAFLILTYSTQENGIDLLIHNGEANRWTNLLLKAPEVILEVEQFLQSYRFITGHYGGFEI